ncbi:dihydrolipoyl dehydrogenase family protein [Microbacterium excoecariae]|uniref:dihydrolipoyl dehydrogenase family protein n=1 Tax=Microbacterium excoecariae TaxID=2715210 RepID=UPI001408AF83|nr:NAD(P)/FAD-dependent oxidoreductase [Microbacterium excoecariae]NHI16589.1 NAD(P)/FAD-dependent oxidoreductase [Microbacterium excoecariae]
MSDTELDLLVLGSGTAGVAAAAACAAEGWRVAVADPAPFGGTCALRGCDPKKILRRGAEIVDAARLLEGRGIDPAGLAIDWAGLMAHKRGFTDAMPQRIEQHLDSLGVRILRGAGAWVSPEVVEVAGERIRARHVVIATGAVPRPLGFDGADLVTDSTGFLELEALPERIVFIGGGFISFEFAHIAARAGAACTIVHRHERPLSGYDPDLVDALTVRTAELGVRIEKDRDVAAVRRAGAALEVTLNDGSVIAADLVVHGAGRVPNTRALGLDAGGIAHSERGIAVDDQLRSTSNPRVFAAGDVADSPGAPLTPVASLEGSAVAQTLLGTGTAPNYRGIPRTVFTIPELTRVGLDADEAREAGHRARVDPSDTAEWFSNYRVGETAAAAHVVVDEDTDVVLGAQLLGPEYAELVNVFALAVRLGLTTAQLGDVVMAYPTVGSDLASLL